MIRVLIVTPVGLIGNVIAHVLEDEPDIAVVGRATSVDEALALVGECDVALISPRLPGDGALKLIGAIASSQPSVKTLALGLTESRERVLQFVEAGADGYVTRDSSVEDLLSCIRAIHEERVFVSPEIAAALVSRLGRYAKLFADVETGLRSDAGLTPREHEILELIAHGLTNQEISDRLTIEVGTVKNHVHNILQKLGVSSREEAAAYLVFIG